MKTRIIELLASQPKKKQPVRVIADALKITGSDEYKELVKALVELEENARVILDDKNRYQLIEHTDYRTGQLDVKDKGFAFLRVDDVDEDDIYIPKNKLKDAMHKDRVLIQVFSSPGGYKQEGAVKRVLERHLTHVIGTVIKYKGRYELISDEKKIKQRILINDNALNGAKPDDKVQAIITNHAHQGLIQVDVMRIIGPKHAKGVDVFSKILAHNIDPEFAPAVLEEADQMPEVERQNVEGRSDYRDRALVTIDGESAKDFDDAVDVKKHADGTYTLGVHIADVSHYVTPGSELDNEAFRRATSIYLVDRVIPMLPERLSNNLCSLMPGVDRYAVSCIMRIDKTGKVIEHTITPSIIRSKARMTYTNVNRILDGDPEITKRFDHVAAMFPVMHELARILEKRRTKQGSLHFETEEAVVTLDSEGRAIDVNPATRGVSEGIIEEFMLIANQTVAEHIHWMDLPFLYRVHEKPTEEKTHKLLSMAQALGFPVSTRNQIGHKELQRLLQKVDNTASEKGINLMMLRSMQKAIYSQNNLGHFGLAFTHYTHFTSPIRRYPDLIVHRLLRTYLFQGDVSEKTVRRYDKRLPDIARHTSERERGAIDLERDVLDMKKAEYMDRYVGETFEGVISSVTPFGIYVGLKNTCEGLVHISDLDDDYYEFDEKLLTLVGARKKRVYRIGDKVMVKVTGTNIFDGEIDFTIAEGGPRENHRTKQKS